MIIALNFTHISRHTPCKYKAGVDILMQSSWPVGLVKEINPHTYSETLTLQS